MRRRRAAWWHVPAAIAGAAFLAWLGGLVWFAGQVPDAIGTAAGGTDAIVVLTGGGQRVEQGLSLLAAGKAKKLFISGVYRRTNLQALLSTAHHPPQWLACCIVLGHEADNTRGNAAETATWMRAEHFNSLRLVTASYHMPRSLLEFRRAMPTIRIVPDPVFPKGAGQRWWLHPRAIALVIGEYAKYLVSLADLQPRETNP